MLFLYSVHPSRWVRALEFSTDIEHGQPLGPSSAPSRQGPHAWWIQEAMGLHQSRSKEAESRKHRVPAFQRFAVIFSDFLGFSAIPEISRQRGKMTNDETRKKTKYHKSTTNIECQSRIPVNLNASGVPCGGITILFSGEGGLVFRRLYVRTNARGAIRAQRRN